MVRLIQLSLPMNGSQHLSLDSDDRESEFKNGRTWLRSKALWQRLNRDLYAGRPF